MAFSLESKNFDFSTFIQHATYPLQPWVTGNPWVLSTATTDMMGRTSKKILKAREWIVPADLIASWVLQTALSIDI